MRRRTNAPTARTVGAFGLGLRAALAAACGGESHRSPAAATAQRASTSSVRSSRMQVLPLQSVWVTDHLLSMARPPTPVGGVAMVPSRRRCCERADCRRARRSVRCLVLACPPDLPPGYFSRKRLCGNKCHLPGTGPIQATPLLYAMSATGFKMMRGRFASFRKRAICRHAGR